MAEGRMRGRNDASWWSLKLAPWLDSLWRDLRFGQRLLRKDAAVSSAAIVSLGLAIGACTAAFSLVDALILRKLPVRDPEPSSTWIAPESRAIGVRLRR